MSTPPLSDEEFDALFRQGLERYPELPDDPAAWLGMELRLEAAARAERLRRRVLRLLGTETIALGLLAGSLLHWVDGRVSPASRLLPREAAVVNPPDPAAVAAARSLAIAAPATRLATSAALPAGQPRPARASAAGASPAAAPGTPSSQPVTTTPTTRTHPLANQPVAAPENDSPHAVAVFAGRRRPQALVAGVAAGTRRAAEHAAHQGAALGRVGEGGTRYPPAAVAGRHGSPNRQLVPPHEHRTGRQPTATHAATGVGAPVAGPPRPATTKAAGHLAEQAAHSYGRAAGRLVSAGSAGRHAATPPAAFTSAAQAVGTGNEAQADAAGVALTGVAQLDPRPGHLALPATTLPTPLLLLPEPAALPTPPEPAPVLDGYRLRVGLTASPELSTVNLHYAPAAGWSVGGYLDYRLARRWHLSAGYLLTLKRYAAEGYDYHAPTDYQHPKWVISDVDAVCRIVDLPVNLRYDFWQRPGRQAFVSLGLSSLLMRSERYTYNYDDLYGRPIAPYTWELTNGSQHYFKVLNLSAGYERALGPRWSVQAEPFVKLPLAGVGFGAVKLASAGVFFSLRYGLLARPVPPTP